MIVRVACDQQLYLALNLQSSISLELWGSSEEESYAVYPSEGTTGLCCSSKELYMTQEASLTSQHFYVRQSDQDDCKHNKVKLMVLNAVAAAELIFLEMTEF